MGRVFDLITLSDDDDDEKDIHSPPHPLVAPSVTPQAEMPLQESLACDQQPFPDWLNSFTALFKTRCADARRLNPNTSDSEISSLFEQAAKEWTQLTAQGRPSPGQQREVRAYITASPPPQQKQKHSSSATSSAARSEIKPSGMKSDTKQKKKSSETLPSASTLSDLDGHAPKKTTESQAKKAILSANSVNKKDAAIHKDAEKVGKHPEIAAIKEEKKVPEPEVTKSSKRKIESEGKNTNDKVRADDLKSGHKIESQSTKRKDANDKNLSKQRKDSDGAQKDHKSGKEAEYDPAAKKKKQHQERDKGEKDSAGRSNDCDAGKNIREKTPASKSIMNGTSQKKVPAATASLSAHSAPVLQKCRGPGCKKMGIDHPEWDGEFCSFRCCVSYANIYFRKWVKRRKDQMAKQAAE